MNNISFISILLFIFIATSCNNIFHDELSTEVVKPEEIDNEYNSSTMKSFAAVYSQGSHDMFSSLTPLPDNECVIATEIKKYFPNESDIWLAKIDQYGGVKWESVIRQMSDDKIIEVKSTSDNGFILLGQTSSYGSKENDIWVVKFAHDGEIEWQKIYGSEKKDIAYGIAETREGNFLIIATSVSYGYDSSCLMILKINSEGSLQKEMIYTFPRREYYNLSISWSINPGSRDHFILTGRTLNVFSMCNEGLLLKVDTSGAILKAKKMSYYHYNFDKPVISRCNKGDYIAGVCTESADGKKSFMSVLKLDSDFNFISEYKVKSKNKKSLHQMIKYSNNEFILIGTAKKDNSIKSSLNLTLIDDRGFITKTKKIRKNKISDLKFSGMYKFNNGYIFASPYLYVNSGATLPAMILVYMDSNWEKYFEDIDRCNLINDDRTSQAISPIKPLELIEVSHSQIFSETDPTGYLIKTQTEAVFIDDLFE